MCLLQVPGNVDMVDSRGVSALDSGRAELEELELRVAAGDSILASPVGADVAAGDHLSQLPFCNTLSQANIRHLLTVRKRPHLVTPGKSQEN